MTITHHPPGDILSDYASGGLSEAEHLVISVHLAQCASCRRFAGMMDQLAGVALAATATAPETSGAFEAVMARIDRSPRTPPQAITLRPPDPELVDLPEPLRRCDIGKRRWLAPGLTTWPIRLSPADGFAEGSRAFLLRGQPGSRMVQHSHTGTELTCILTGSYSHDGGRYAAGDLDFGDEEVEHEPRVGNDGPCLCIFAVTGHFKMSGLLGRLISPFIRI